MLYNHNLRLFTKLAHYTPKFDKVIGINLFPELVGQALYAMQYSGISLTKRFFDYADHCMMKLLKHFHRNRLLEYRKSVVISRSNNWE